MHLNKDTLADFNASIFCSKFTPCLPPSAGQII